MDIKQQEKIIKRREAVRRYMKKNPREALYKKWMSMNSRCGNPKEESYKNYGGRGIKVCKRWKLYDNFKKDMGGTYLPGLTLDRINNDKNYSPKNCHWVTQEVQANNKRNNVRLTYKKKTQTLTQWAKEFNIKPRTLWMRVKVYKWTMEKALNKIIWTDSQNLS